MVDLLEKYITVDEVQKHTLFYIFRRKKKYFTIYLDNLQLSYTNENVHMRVKKRGGEVIKACFKFFFQSLLCNL